MKDKQKVREYIARYMEEAQDDVDTYEYQTALMLEDMLREIGNLRGLLVRYRTETPLGHQPHMIAAEVDAVLAD